jgi:hypothetical protein
MQDPEAGEDPELLANTPATAPGDVPDTEGTADQQQVEDVQESELTAAAVMGAAELTALRLRELAGSRLRSKVGAQECIDGIPNALVASTLSVAGNGSLEASRHDATELVRNGTASLGALCLQKGIAPPAAEKLCSLVASHAAKHLFDPEPPGLPEGIGAYVKRIL